jgi:hypothetical protein
VLVKILAYLQLALHYLQLIAKRCSLSLGLAVPLSVLTSALLCSLLGGVGHARPDAQEGAVESVHPGQDARIKVVALLLIELMFGRVHILVLPLISETTAPVSLHTLDTGSRTFGGTADPSLTVTGVAENGELHAFVITASGSFGIALLGTLEQLVLVVVDLVSQFHHLLL